MKKENLFTLSENGKAEYSASIVKIGELIPIEGSDFLSKTVVDGFDIVVRKDMVHPGDLMVFCRIETVLDKSFLNKNNLFELHSRELNSNYEQVQALIDSGKEDIAKTMVGFFTKSGRVKIVKLRGCPSMGFLFSKDSLVKWKPSLFKDINLEDYIDIPYWDTIDGKEFLHVYVPPVNTIGNKASQKNKKVERRFDKLIPGQFSFHYDTNNINKEMYRFTPKLKVSISVKLHGTSICIGNVLTKIPRKSSPGQTLINLRRKKLLSKRIKRIKKYNPGLLKDPSIQKSISLQKSKIKLEYTEKYSVIYSSRTVIKNQFINKNVGSGYYGEDVWGDYYRLLHKLIPKGFEIFGEIVGYLSSGSMIQKNYDYGCEANKNKLMIYRVTERLEDGTKKEYNVSEVLSWTKKLIKDHPEISQNIHPIDLLWNGTLQELYPDVPVDSDWNKNILERLKNDDRFGMEKREPLCKKKVPREGIVVRIDDDPVSEAWKLKTFAFLNAESKNIDLGEVDIELQNGSY